MNITSSIQEGYYMFTVIFADEAIAQLTKLDQVSRNKIIKGLKVFQAEGANAKNSKPLGNSLWEIKKDNVRAYFMYENNKIIIVGLITLKKSQKAPKRFIEQAIKNIEKTRLQLKEGNNYA